MKKTVDESRNQKHLSDRISEIQNYSDLNDEQKLVKISEICELFKNRNFKAMDFYKTQAIIKQIVEYCVEGGEIDYFFATTLKELFIVTEYITDFESIKEEDETVDVQSTFTKIRDEGHYKMFVSSYNRRDLIEFEELLEKSLNQESKIQLENIRKSTSIETVVDDFLIGILAKIPDEKAIGKFVKGLPKLLKNIDKGTLDEIKKVAENLNIGKNNE